MNQQSTKKKKTSIITKHNYVVCITILYISNLVELLKIKPLHIQIKHLYYLLSFN